MTPTAHETAARAPRPSRAGRLLRGVAAAVAGLTTASCAASGRAASGTPAPTWTSASPTAGALKAVHDAAATTARSSASIAVELDPGALFGVAQAPVSGSGDFDFGATQGRIQLREASGTETVIFVPQALFVREPSSGGGGVLPAGKTWISAGLTERPAPGSSIPQFVDQAEAVNADLVLHEVAWGAVTAAPLGTARVGGAPAQGYAVTVDLRQAAGNATGPAAPAFSQAAGYQMASLVAAPAGSARMHVVVWVGPGGRVVRLQSSPPGSGVGSVKVTLSGFGVAVRVAPPRPPVTVDIASLSGTAEQEKGLGDIA